MQKIFSVYDKEFQGFGRVWSGLDERYLHELSVTLDCSTPLPEGTEYEAEDVELASHPVAKRLAPALYGGMPVQFGWCNGHNLKLNCLEYHRSSEFNLGVRDFILLLAKQSQLSNNKLDTSSVVAFRVPADTLVEVYATTLHYAPCQVSDNGFKVLVALPKGTNLPLPNDDTPDDENVTEPKGSTTSGKFKLTDEELLWATNKWLIAHPESTEAKLGAFAGLAGKNTTLSNMD